MSLNCEEIDLVLKEFPLEGLKIQNIFQPSYDSIVLELYGRGQLHHYFISIAHNACRLHPMSVPPPKNERPLRFMELLRSRIRGGTILSATQISKDRIVKIDVVRSSEDGSPRTLHLFARLWSGAGNVLLVSEEGTIIDALRRLPARGETSGAVFSLPLPRNPSLPEKKYAIRDLEGEGPFWQKIERVYGQTSGHLSRETLIQSARELYEKKKSALETRLSQLELKEKEFDQSDRFRQIGDILLSGYTTETFAKKYFARAFDFYENKEILVEIDAGATPAQNSMMYYEKYRKAKNGIEEIRTEISRTRSSLAHLSEWIAHIENATDPLAIAKELRVGGAARVKEKPKYPFQHLEYRGWTIFIGRSGKENDEILRHYAKGFDLWLHARDYAGSYVFVKAQKNKSIPPDVVQAASRLALYYSKARKNGGGDVYSTFAKNLRRVKDGPVGMVIPYLEKNLYITFTETQIREILETAETDEEETKI